MRWPCRPLSRRAHDAAGSAKQPMARCLHGKDGMHGTDRTRFVPKPVATTTALLAAALALLTWDHCGGAVGCIPHACASASSPPLPPRESALSRFRRSLNLSSTFGSPTTAPSYERIASQPVFAVTTPWGSPYLIFERADDDDDAGGGGGYDNEEEAAAAGSKRKARDNFGDVMGPEASVRQVVLYFSDPMDACAHRDEMMQLEQMKGADMRIMATSLGRAVRQASNLGQGLVTGQPIDELTGRARGADEGGLLRYKIVPSRKELFYAARCRGRERVGLFGDSASADASIASNSRRTVGEYVAGLKAAREDRLKSRRRQQQRLQASPTNTAEQDHDEALLRIRYGHMEGALGMPVFHCPALRRRQPPWKKIFRLASSAAATSDETPLFFSYEDLREAWDQLRERASRNDEKVRNTRVPSATMSKMPVYPPGVEVYNLMDVVSSIDQHQWKAKRDAELRKERLLGAAIRPLCSIPVVKGLIKKVATTSTAGGSNREKADSSAHKKIMTRSGLESITFVPSSRNVEFKDQITCTGNGKARLRPMRVWGREMM